MCSPEESGSTWVRRGSGGEKKRLIREVVTLKRRSGKQGKLQRIEVLGILRNRKRDLGQKGAGKVRKGAKLPRASFMRGVLLVLEESRGQKEKKWIRKKGRGMGDGAKVEKLEQVLNGRGSSKGGGEGRWIFPSRSAMPELLFAPENRRNTKKEGRGTLDPTPTVKKSAKKSARLLGPARTSLLTRRALSGLERGTITFLIIGRGETETRDCISKGGSANHSGK